jgi:uncharacterized protein DUF4255
MTSYRVIAAVTAALKQVLQTAAAPAVGNCDIRLGPPTAKIGEETTPRVNMFLFRISPNPAFRNDQLPVRGSDGHMRNAAQAVVDLHYVLSFYGDASKYEPEKLLGATTIALEEVPALFASAIASAVQAIDPNDSSLSDALARVRFTRQQMSLEDFSKLWSVFFQVPYALSAVYVCSHVVLESQQAIGSAIPVTRTDFSAGPVAGFSLFWAAADQSGSGPVLWPGPLHLAGEGLGTVGTSLRIDDQIVPIDPDDLAAKAIKVTLATPEFAELAAGIHVAQAIAPPATPATPENLRRRSNAVSFAVHPKIVPGAVTPGAGPPKAGTIKVDFTPKVAAGQSVTLTLDSRDPNDPRSIVLDPDPPDASGASLDFPFSGVPAGNYLVRAHVDGFASPPEVEADPNSPDFGLITGPEVAL